MTQLNDIEKKKLYSLFKNIDSNEVSSSLNKTQNSDILLVDGLNTFCRSFAANPQCNLNGLHVGGIVGFLKSLGYAIKLINPTRCIVVFDGQGGSYRRKQLFPEYKQHRSNKVRLNRIFEDNSTTENESQAIARQLIRISHYLDVFPVTTIQMDNVEADDVIAYLSLNSFKNSNVTIMSTDKDFYQIVNDKIKIYSPTKKKIYGPTEVFDEFGIHTKNFTLYRTLDGDVSDGICGIKGFGLKTTIKAFPFLTEDKQYDIQDLYNYAELHKDKLKVYETLLENKQIVERNYQLMQLNESIIASFAQLNIEDILKKKNKLNRYAFTNMMRDDQLTTAMPNGLVWLETIFSKLDSYIIL